MKSNLESSRKPKLGHSQNGFGLFGFHEVLLGAVIFRFNLYDSSNFVDIDRETYYRSYVNIYLQRDIRALVQAAVKNFKVLEPVKEPEELKWLSAI